MSKKPIKTPSPAILAAQERNRKEQEYKERRARRKNTLRTLVSAMTAILDAWYYGTHDGGWSGDYCFPVLEEIPEKKRPSWAKRMEKIHDAHLEVIRQYVPTKEQINIFFKKCCHAVVIQDALEKRTAKYLPNWTSYDALRIQTGVYAACLVDWLELELTEEDYIEETDAVYILIKELARFSELTISQKDSRMRDVLTICYWNTWLTAFGLNDFKEHPNHLRNLRIPKLAEIEGILDDGSNTPFDGLALVFDDHFAMEIKDYSEENKLRHDKELKEKKPILDKYTAMKRTNAVKKHVYPDTKPILPLSGEVIIRKKAL